jgi:Fe-S oxidoreductase/nitrate reductase gamma subunit
VLHALVQDRVWKRLYPGVMHFMLFWGVSIQVLGTAISLMQTTLFLPFSLPFPRDGLYLGFELTMDLAGGMIYLGVGMALFRRLVLRPKTLSTTWDDWYALLLLLLIPTLGFITEGLRLLSIAPQWAAWSPIGSLFARLLGVLGLRETAIVQARPYLFWAHATAGLLFLASIPFTKLRHLITGPLNIYSRPDRHPGSYPLIEDLETAETLGVGRIAEFEPRSLMSFDACVQCGRCEERCPSAISGMEYSPRSLLLTLRENMHTSLVWSEAADGADIFQSGLDSGSPWLCTTCGACIDACPMFVNPVDAIIDLRRYLTLTTGQVPSSVGETLRQMERYGNPWGLPPEERAPWIRELELPVLEPGGECDVLLFLGCAYSYDARNQAAGRQLAKLLLQADVDFAVLGPAEGCCGETARRLGHEYVFQVMAQENIAMLEALRFNSIVTPCAHCFNSLKNEYPALGGEFHILHHSEYLAQLAAAGRLQPGNGAPGRVVAYHDSCYLGRYNQVYDAPRSALDAVPGMRRLELTRRRENGFCCGGGGGHMWMETDPNTRINHRRLAEVLEADEANIIATACPYCMIMLDDAVRSKGLTEQIRVQDIAEILGGAEGAEAQ